MKIIYRSILLAGCLYFASGSLTAQGLTLSKLPALINDSIVGITIPQMDYLVQYKHSNESTYDMLMLYKVEYEKCNDQSSKRLEQIVAQSRLLNTYVKQEVLLSTNVSNLQLSNDSCARQLKKARFNGTLGWIAAAVIGTAGTILYITK